MVVVDDLILESPKTKAFVGVLNALQVEGTTLVVASGQDRNLSLASRNVPTGVNEAGVRSKRSVGSTVST